MRAIFLLNHRLYHKCIRKNKHFRVKSGFPHSLRKWQMMRFTDDDKLVYAYEFNEEGYSKISDTYIVSINDITKICYSRKRRLVIIYGDVARSKTINCMQYEEKCSSFEFLECFDEKIIKLLLQRKELKDKIVFIK